MIEQLLLETFFGGLTGYVTNDVAIKGLFKKDGVVEKTRDEFIHEASALLEEQVLTQAVLRERLTLASVEQAMDELLRHFFLRDVPEVLHPLAVGELSGYADLVDIISKEVGIFWQQEQEAITRLLQTKLDLAELLPSNEQKVLAEKLSAVVREELAQGQYGERFVTQWLTQAGDKNLSQLGLAEFVHSLAEQIMVVIGKWLAKQEVENNAAWQELVEHLWQQLELNELLSALEQVLRIRTLAEFFPEGAAPLVQTLTETLSSVEGEAVWNKLTSRLLQMAASSETPLSQLFGEDAKALVLPFIRQQLPDIISGVLAWLAGNEEAVNHLIEEAIDETIMEAGEFKNMILLMVRENLLESLFGEHILLEKARAFLEEQTDPEKMAEQLTEKLLVSIGQITPKGLIELAGGALGPLYRVLRQFLRDNGLAYCRHYLAQTLDDLMAQPIGRWLPEGLAERYGQQLSVELSRWLADKLGSEWLQEALQRAGQNYAGKLCQTSLQNTVMDYDACVTKWADMGQRFLENVTLPFDKWLAQLVDGKGIATIVAHGDKLMPQAVSTLGKHWAQKSLADAYKAILTEQRVENLLPVCRAFISDKLLEAAQGNLSRLAENSLNQLSNEEMLQLVQDFMGRELKPLNYLGALLGGAVGLVTGALVAGPMGAVAGASTTAMVTTAAARSVVYGAVGYGTNCAAIKGLFWPYKPVAGVRMLQGVVPKQKERFANSLGQMVSRYVLNEDILQDILIGGRANWQTIGVTMAMEPQVMESILVKGSAKQAEITQSTYQALSHLSQEQLPIWWDKLAMAPLRTYIPADKLSISVDEQKLGERLVQEAAAFCQTEERLSRWIDEERSLLAAERTLKKQLPHICQSGLDSIADYYDTWQKQPLANAIPSSWQKAAKKGLPMQLRRILGSEKMTRWIADGVNRFLQVQTLGEAFGGKLDQWVMANVDRLVQMVLEEVITWLAEKQDMVAKLVQEQIRKNLGFVQLMGYMAMNGDGLVEQVVVRLLTVKLPPFLRERQPEIAGAVQRYWQTHLAPLSPTELSLTVTAEAVQTLGERLCQQSGVWEQLMDILSDLLHLLGRVPVEKWSASTAFGDHQSMERALGAEKTLLTDWLQTHWQQSQDEIIRPMMPLAQAFLRWLAHSSVADILAPCAEDLAKLDGEKLLANGQGGELMREAVSAIAMHLFDAPIGAWIDQQALGERVVVQVESLLASEEFQALWRRLWADILDDLPQLWSEMPEAMRTQLIEMVIQAFLNSVQQDASAVLKEMNLPQVTSIQVQAMDAQSLEKLVHGFAKPYFKHIQNMGWLGAGFAIPGIILSYLLL